MSLFDKIKGAFADLLTELAGESGWLNEKLNSLAINKLASAGRSRPHPWSTRDDYISWSGLTDRNYNARLLPAKDPPAGLPDSTALATIFLAGDRGQRECGKSTCLFPAFAQYLTDGFIRTQMANDEFKEDRKRTTSNHEIDQSPLYGRTERQTRALRTLSEAPGQKGRLKSQMIGGEEYSKFLYDPDGKLSDEWIDKDTKRPILDAPLGIDVNTPKATLFAAGGDRVNAAPQVAMMNTLFLREHNRLAGMLERLNPAWRDEQVFQTARNIVIVMFIKIVIEEYINHINTEKFKLRALPVCAWKADWNRTNWITAEFSLLYRWHSLVPATMRWGEKSIAMKDALLNNSALLERGLANAFVDISANNATALGLFNSAPPLLRAEQKAIDQAREVRLQNYNAYRREMKMDPAESFEDIAGKPEKARDAAERAHRERVIAALKQHYGTPDRVEFYPGLFAEPRDRNGPLPPLIQKMVAMDAFSQAMTNPLLSRHIWGEDRAREAAFTKQGLAEIKATVTLRDVLARNSVGLGDRFVGMTRADWRRD